MKIYTDQLDRLRHWATTAVLLGLLSFGTSCSDDYSGPDRVKNVELTQLCANPGAYDGELIEFSADISVLSECTSVECDVDAGDSQADAGSGSCCNDCVYQPTYVCPNSSDARIMIRFPTGQPASCRQSECARSCWITGDGGDERRKFVLGTFVNQPAEGEGLNGDGPEFDYVIEANQFGDPLM